MDTIWLAEAYPWWRKHGMEARSSTVASAVMARETERLTIGWGIISPFTRHPVQVAMDARVVQEAAGPGRFILGFGTSKIFLNNAQMQTNEDARPDARRGRDRRGACSAGERSSTRARPGAPRCRRSPPRRRAARGAAGLRGRDGAEDAGARGRDRRRLPDAVDHDAGLRRATRARTSARDIDIGCTIVASIHETDRDAGRDGAREIAGMYLANKVQNIQGAADTLLDLAGIEQDEIRPVAEAMERGGRLAAKAEVTDALLDKCKPIAGTPDDCIAAIEEYKEAGCTHVMLELWGERRPRADPALRRACATSGPMIDADAFNAFEAEGWESVAGGYHRFWGTVTANVCGLLLDAAASARERAPWMWPPALDMSPPAPPRGAPRSSDWTSRRRWSRWLGHANREWSSFGRRRGAPVSRRILRCGGRQLHDPPRGEARARRGRGAPRAGPGRRSRALGVGRAGPNASDRSPRRRRGRGGSRPAGPRPGRASILPLLGRR